MLVMESYMNVKGFIEKSYHMDLIYDKDNQELPDINQTKMQEGKNRLTNLRKRRNSVIRI